MVEIDINYQGELRCLSKHAPSGEALSTDAPVDNNGKGASFSPTDLLAAALGSCMATIMGIVAERKSISLEGLNIKVEKEMSHDLPRRISLLKVMITVPAGVAKEHYSILKNAALTCPVHQSLHPEIDIPIDWVYPE